MKTKTKKLVWGLLAAVLTLSSPASRADEGMWMTGHLPSGAYAAMRSLGFRLTPDRLSNADGTGLQGAVVLFGGYCTGVVVSREGLLFTNHHCGFESIHAHSTPEHDYLRHGFYARTAAEEWPVPGLYVSFPVRADRVTDRVLPLLQRTDSLGRRHQVWGEKRTKIVDSLQTVMNTELIGQDSTLRADLVSYYGGNEYYLNVYRDYTDVRLVLAPPVSAGKFGGETDNWMWPRETCDFSVFRIYARDGKPAPYSPDNTPLTPKAYAPISLAGYRPGSFSMTMGFPGSTYRYLSSYGITDRMTAINEPVIEVRTLKQSIWRQAMDNDSVVRLKYDNKYVGSANFWKNSIGMNRSLREKNVVAEKQAFERSLSDWIASDTALQRKYAGLFDRLREAYETSTASYRELWFYRETFFGSCDLLELAMNIHGGAFDKNNPHRAKALTQAADLYRDFDAALDERTLAALMRNLMDHLDAARWPSCYAEVAGRYGGSFSSYAAALYRRTLLTDSARTLRLLREGKTQALDHDPMLLLARAVLQGMGPLVASADLQPRREAERELQQAVREMYEKNALYPDANMTVRLSYGTVHSYDPRPGQTYPLYTTPASLGEKAKRQNENREYFMEPELLSLLESGQYGPYADPSSGTLQLCFISDNDITGGNSGSPVFNGKGELMGLAFDGNWESMANDLKYDPALTRCINVDIRYVLFLMQKWSGADRLIRELDLRK